MPATLSDLIHTLTQPHLRRAGENIAHEDALLDILKSLITPSGATKGGSEGGGGGGGSRPPINLDALSLWQEIERKVERNWPGAGNTAYVRIPLGNKLRAWHANTHDPHDAIRLLEHCERWVARIREALEPTKRMPLKGACPTCDKTHVETLDEDGKARYNTAIIAYPQAQPPYAQCQVCEHTWENGALHELAEKIIA